MPRHDVGIGCIWPAATGREILRKALAFDAPARRDDIVVRQCNRRGVDSSDVILYQAGAWALRTSLSRRFEDPDEGRAALLRLARKKMQLGRLLSPLAALSIQPESSGAVWLWSASPWLATLEDQLDDARRGRDAAAVERLLVAFAEGAASGLALASKQRILLEIHPNNFALVDDVLFYVSDEIEQGSRIMTIGESILRRCEEYSSFAPAVEALITTFVAALDRAVGRAAVEELGVEESFKLASERSLAANDAYTLFARLLGASV